MKNTKQPVPRKLALGGETIRALSISELGRAAGGESNGNCASTICTGQVVAAAAA
jgi:hypothetical protein